MDKIKNFHSMKKIRAFLIGIGILIFFNSGFSQSYNMSNSTEITCSGTFYDSGGENNDYNKNENLTMTFEPGTVGSVLKFVFTEFELEYKPQCNKDYLIIYDGLNTSAAEIGQYCGTDTPGTIMATSASGAITFVFVSDNKNTNYPGWAADIECVISGNSFTGIWNGNTSTDWSIGSNWDDGNVPGYLTDVTISSTPGGGNFPETNSGSEAVCNNLTIASGAHLYIPSDNALTVFGDLTNNAGTSGLIVKSDASGIGSLIHSTTGVNATVEQYLSSEQWHLVSAPVSNATINSYLDIYLKEYNEPDSTWTYLVEPVTTPLNITEGYAVWVSDGLTGTTSVSFPGTLVSSDQSVNVSYTNGANHQGKGFNLIGNPYPSYLDWNSNWNMVKMSGWMVVYNNGVYQGYHTSGTSYNGKTDGIIPPTQGFWVRATQNNPSLTIPNSERLNADQAFYKYAEKESIDLNHPSIRLESTINGFTDEAVVVFHPECTNMFDDFYDLQKFSNVIRAPQLCIISNDTSYAVNFMEEDYHNKIIELGFKTGAEGIYEIAASTISNFDNSICIYLEDRQTKTICKLMEHDPYSFSYNPLDDFHRFNLHFNESTFSAQETNISNIHVYSYRNEIQVQTNAQQTGKIIVNNILGQRVITEQLDESGKTTIQLNSGTGYYVVSIYTDDAIYTQKIFIK